MFSGGSGSSTRPERFVRALEENRARRCRGSALTKPEPAPFDGLLGGTHQPWRECAVRRPTLVSVCTKVPLDEQTIVPHASEARERACGLQVACRSVRGT